MHFKKPALLLFYGLFMIVLAACSHPNSHITEFEGIITYKISYKNFRDSALYGDTLKLYYSQGNIVKLYNSKVPKGLKAEYFMCETAKCFYLKVAGDTLFSSDIGKPHNIFTTGTQDTISPVSVLNYPCREFKSGHVHIGTYTYYIFDTYIYSQQALPINPEHFKNFNYLNFNDFVNQSGAFYLHYENQLMLNKKYDLGTKIVDAIKIEPMHIDPQKFKLPNLIVAESPNN